MVICWLLGLGNESLFFKNVSFCFRNNQNSYSFTWGATRPFITPYLVIWIVCWTTIGRTQIMLSEDMLCNSTIFHPSGFHKYLIELCTWNWKWSQQVQTDLLKGVVELGGWCRLVRNLDSGWTTKITKIFVTCIFLHHLCTICKSWTFLYFGTNDNITKLVAKAFSKILQS